MCTGARVRHTAEIRRHYAGARWADRRGRGGARRKPVQPRARARPPGAGSAAPGRARGLTARAAARRVGAFGAGGDRVGGGAACALRDGRVEQRQRTNKTMATPGSSSSMTLVGPRSRSRGAERQPASLRGAVRLARGSSAGNFCPSQRNSRLSARSRQRVNDGNHHQRQCVDVMSPPITQTAMGARVSPPSLSARATGNMPKSSRRSS